MLLVAFLAPCRRPTFPRNVTHAETVEAFAFTLKVIACDQKTWLLRHNLRKNAIADSNSMTDHGYWFVNPRVGLTGYEATSRDLAVKVEY